MTKDNKNNDKNRMTEKELDKLASKIVAKLMDIQNAFNWYETHTYDNSWLSRNIHEKRDEELNGLSEEEILIAELAKLMTMMNMYQDKEEYEKCAKIKKKIDKVNKRLNKIRK